MDRRGLIAVALVAASVLTTVEAGAREIVLARGLSHGRIVLLDADGHRRVIARERYVSNPVWSPDHSRVAFAAVLKAGFEYVSLVSRSGRHERRVTDFGWRFPSWTPDGKLTVSCDHPGACELRAGLYVFDPDRPRMHRISRTAGASASAWAPSGKRLVLVLERHGREELFVKQVGRPRLRRLTRTDVDEAAPDWSPNGRWIVYSRPPRRPDEPHDLWLIHPGNGRLKRLTKTSGNETNPSWSPSGRRILFSTPRGFFSIRKNGTHRRRVDGSRKGDCCPDW